MTKGLLFLLALFSLIWTEEIPQETCLDTVGITRQEFNTSFSMFLIPLADVKTEEYLQCVWKKHNIIDSEGKVDKEQYHNFFIKFLALYRNWDSETTQHNEKDIISVLTNVEQLNEVPLLDPISLLNNIKLTVFALLFNERNNGQANPFEVFMKVY
ncbi:hypothetical protein FQA39_LY10132 [Lamprigera yunnana]|nr:hypothetical protein FQA39_LY10132 [Lamprigera yunnana]